MKATENIAANWRDYECLDAGDGEKLERWGKFVLQRPDPTAIWPKANPALWSKADAIYHRSKAGGGFWQYIKKLPETWNIQYQDLTFKVSPTGFKHTGLFPEQAANWDWFSSLIQNAATPVKVLNLFAYTGGATMAAAKAGASLTHVDAAKGMVSWAKENSQLCQLENHPIRYLVDDVPKFIQREIRRNNHYEGIILDPPSYGRGPGGEVWKLEDQLYTLLSEAARLLSEKPLFFLINTYTTGFSALALANILNLIFSKQTVETGQLGLPITESKLVLPCGIYGRVIF